MMIYCQLGRKEDISAEVKSNHNFLSKKIYAFQNVAYKIAAIYSRPQYVNLVKQTFF